MKPPAITASLSWPCANCQATVSSERCPTCQGVQVRIVGQEAKHLHKAAWLERLSPALRLTPTVPEYEFRPLDPVACVLAAAPSPVVDETRVVALQEIEERMRLRKKRPVVVRDVPESKKSKLLSAV